MHAYLVPLVTIYKTTTLFYQIAADDSENNCEKRENVLHVSNFSFSHNYSNPTKAYLQNCLRFFFY